MVDDKVIEKIIKERIREVPDWPKKGVDFKDITPLLQDGSALSRIIDVLAAPYVSGKIDKVVGIDARGFILAAGLAYKLKTGMAIIRKQGKLPAQKISQEYSLEYASNTIEMHKDAIAEGERVVMVDDVLATGGTMKAAVDLVERLKGRIAGIDFLIELTALQARKKLKGYKIRSLAQY